MILQATTYFPCNGLIHVIYVLYVGLHASHAKVGAAEGDLERMTMVYKVLIP